MYVLVKKLCIGFTLGYCNQSLVILCCRPVGFTSAINSISANSSFSVSDEEKKRIIDEENQRLQQLKVSLEAAIDLTDNAVC